MTTRLYLHATPITLQPAHGEAIALALSLDRLLADGLARFPPGEAAIERAIATTEDALMPHVAALRAHPLEVLWVADDGLAALPTLLGDEARTRWHIDAVERAFNLLADVAAGLPAHRAGLPAQPRFIAALVVVRELMHHVGWQQLQLPQPD